MPEYNYKEINDYYHSSKEITLRDCQAKFGISTGRWATAVKRGDITKKDRSIKHVNLFCENSSSTRATVKERILKENLLEYKCSLCELTTQWNNKLLVLQLDHINGIHNDHRLENIRWLCPNCHSQTDTYAGKNPSYKY